MGMRDAASELRLIRDAYVLACGIHGAAAALATGYTGVGGGGSRYRPGVRDALLEFKLLRSRLVRVLPVRQAPVVERHGALLPMWPCVSCTAGRVTSLDVFAHGLTGTLGHVMRDAVAELAARDRRDACLRAYGQ
ncbi:hypothetical protein BAE44_0009214 [Dichanthelium oligosanthes]|uniref:Uncharacterized protein n=1 Tax=Dichanthelium oligosanthes TaxID=888268 RepID=A0A1E5VXC8_9POAL|nr:hypothetical protein BAE44_0009214 [Dichanthelium oligosanthes]